MAINYISAYMHICYQQCVRVQDALSSSSYEIYRTNLAQRSQRDDQVPVKIANLYANRTFGEILFLAASFCFDVSRITIMLRLCLRNSSRPAHVGSVDITPAFNSREKTDREFQR